MRNRMTIAAMMAGLTLGFAAQAAEPASQPVDETPAYFNGVKVAIDPATGRLRQPTAAEIRALRTAVAPKTDNMSIGKPMPKTQAAADKTYRQVKTGGVMVQLPESSMASMAAVQRADGSIRVGDADANGNLNDTQEAASE